MKQEHLIKLYERPKAHGEFTGWAKEHECAVYHPREDSERAIVELFTGRLRYADAHRRRYESGIGCDGVLGEEWAAIGKSLIGLLNGECGRLDCGTLDSLARNVLHSEGFDPENL